MFLPVNSAAALTLTLVFVAATIVDCQQPAFIPNGPGFYRNEPVPAPVMYGPPPPQQQPPRFGPIVAQPPQGDGYRREEGPYESTDNAEKHQQKEEALEDKKLAKELKKHEHEQKKHEYEKDAYGDKSTTEKPGVLSSFQTSMTDAWKSFTKLGGASDSRSTKTKRSLEPEYNSLESGYAGEYVYLKVPKNLVCQ